MTVSVNTSSSGIFSSSTGPAEVFANTYPLPTITTPAAGATGVSKTITVVTKEGVASESTMLLYGIGQSLGTATTFLFGTASSSDIPYNPATGVVTLDAGIEYELTAAIYGTGFSNATGGYGLYQWVDSTTKTKLTAGAGAGAVPSTFASTVSQQSTAKAVYRTTVSTDVELRCYEANGTFTADATRSWATVRTTATKYLDYTHAASQIEVALSSTGEIVFDSGEVASLSAAVTPALAGTTVYKTRTRHKGDSGYWTNWSGWTSFTTIA